jgi:hypothetical protein
VIDAETLRALLSWLPAGTTVEKVVPCREKDGEEKDGEEKDGEEKERV